MSSCAFTFPETPFFGQDTVRHTSTHDNCPMSVKGDVFDNGGGDTHADRRVYHGNMSSNLVFSKTALLLDVFCTPLG